MRRDSGKPRSVRKAAAIPSAGRTPAADHALALTGPTAITGLVDWAGIEWGSRPWNTATAHLMAMVGGDGMSEDRGSLLAEAHSRLAGEDRRYEDEMTGSCRRAAPGRTEMSASRPSSASHSGTQPPGGASASGRCPSNARANVARS